MVTKVYGTQGVDKVQDNVIATADLQDGAVTAAKIASGVAGTGPAFSAKNSVDQSISSSTWTKVALPTKVYDTDSCFDASLYRFTPNIEGYYQLNAVWRYEGTPLNRYAAFYKNGSALRIMEVSLSQEAIVQLAGSDLFYANGTTDYFEIWGSMSSATAAFGYSSTTASCTFSGFLARAV